MTKIRNYKNILRAIIYTILVCVILFFGVGVYDYIKYEEVKALATGFPLECGVVSTGAVIPACNRAASGKCSCLFCEASPCNGNTEIQFTGQPTPKCSTNFFCVDPSFQAYTGSPPKPGDQAIVGATSYIITANAVYGTPGIGYKPIDKIINLIDKYIIASFKD